MPNIDHLNLQVCEGLVKLDLLFDEKISYNLLCFITMSELLVKDKSIWWA